MESGKLMVEKNILIWEEQNPATRLHSEFEAPLRRRHGGEAWEGGGRWKLGWPLRRARSDFSEGREGDWDGAMMGKRGKEAGDGNWDGLRRRARPDFFRREGGRRGNGVAEAENKCAAVLIDGHHSYRVRSMGTR